MSGDTFTMILKAIDTYATMHPRPPHVSQTQAARMLHVSRPTMSRMVKAGTFTLNDCGLIPITQIDRAVQGNRHA